MSTEAGHQRVAAEFMGKGRALCNAVRTDVVGINDALKAAIRPIQARWLRNPANPSITPEHLTKLRQALDRAPGAAYRLGPIEFVGGCKRFSVGWHQLRTARWSLDAWDENEIGLLISRVCIRFIGT